MSCFYLELLHGNQRGRSAEAEIAFERLLGGSHFKSAMAEFSKLDRGDEAEAVKFSELLYGRHFRGVYACHFHVIICSAWYFL